MGTLTQMFRREHGSKLDNLGERAIDRYKRILESQSPESLRVRELRRKRIILNVAAERGGIEPDLTPEFEARLGNLLDAMDGHNAIKGRVAEAQQRTREDYSERYGKAFAKLKETGVLKDYEPGTKLSPTLLAEEDALIGQLWQSHLAIGSLCKRVANLDSDVLLKGTDYCEVRRPIVRQPNGDLCPSWFTQPPPQGR